MVNNDILQQIKDANTGRQKRSLKIKYKAMAESPFRFFRGTCQLFYQELMQLYPFPASPVVWACGDLHIENFGSYKGSNRLVYFDLNDFDESLMAPALWEICRLTASVQVAANEAGFSKTEKRDLLHTLINSYSQTLQKGKPVVIEKGAARGIIRKLFTKVADRKEMDLVKKRTDQDNPGKLLISETLFALEKKERKSIINSFDEWLVANAHHDVKVLDAGFRIAGTGSIGVKRYILLLARTGDTPKKLLIDMKQAMPSAAARYTNTPQPLWKNDADRIISIQEMMEHVSPAFLSSFQYADNWFVIKELQPTADKVNFFQTIREATWMQHYLADLGTLTASAQLRSGGRKGSATADELCAFAANNNWQAILADWSETYAEQVKKDYTVYRNAWEAGFFAG